MKKVLILGKNSYIGKNIYNWLEKFKDGYDVDIISCRKDTLVQHNFSSYDVVINCMGKAHINNISNDMRNDFFLVNSDLAIDCANKAKQDGVGQYIFLSSMNIYGDSCGIIHNLEDVRPTSFYGESKLSGDRGVRSLACDEFRVACVRPPFVYGKNCSGNYNTIRKIAVKTPLFPDYDNKKSMIYIDNLCEFIRLLIEKEMNGYFAPQNRELVSTARLVKEIARCNKRRIVFTKIFNPIITALRKYNNTCRRAFADDACELNLSNIFNFDYCIVSFEDSISRTEL